MFLLLSVVIFLVFAFEVLVCFAFWLFNCGFNVALAGLDLILLAGLTSNSYAIALRRLPHVVVLWLFPVICLEPLSPFKHFYRSLEPPVQKFFSWIRDCWLTVGWFLSVRSLFAWVVLESKPRALHSLEHSTTELYRSCLNIYLLKTKKLIP